MFKKTKKRCENIKNFGKTTFEDMKGFKSIQNIDGESIGIMGLTLVIGLGIGYLASLLPSRLYGTFTVVLILISLVTWIYEKIYSKKN